MSLKNKLKEAYSQKVTNPKGYDSFKGKSEVTKTHYYLFKSLKLTGFVALGIVGVFALTVGGMALAASMQFDEHAAESVKKVRFSMYDTNLIESETFKYLNSIEYTSQKEFNIINEDFVTYVNKFAENTYKGFDKAYNFAYSPLMLYTQMDLISLAVSNDEAMNEINTALGTDDATMRGENVLKAMLNNSFANKEEKSTVQTKNAVFYDPYRANSNINPTFLEELTKRHAEAYNLSYDTDISYILKWIDESVNENGFLTEKDLDIDELTFISFVSSLYFDNTWESKYCAENTKEKEFHLANGEIVKTKFMNHVIGTEFEDFDKYVSIKDYYKNGYYVQYYVPKSLEDNIFDLLPENFLTKAPEEETNYRAVSLSMPKFEIECKNDISEVVKGAGIKEIYNRDGNCLLNAIENPSYSYSYVKHTKQKTTVSFDEDGTVVKSVTFSMGNGAKASPNGFDIDLDQPFVYCIKDRSGLPLVLGAITNPLQ